MAYVRPLAPANNTEPCVNAVLTPVPPLEVGRTPVTPVVSGSPVALVSDKFVKVGLSDSTTEPVPVEVVTPVPPLRTGNTLMEPKLVNASDSTKSPVVAPTARVKLVPLVAV